MATSWQSSDYATTNDRVKWYIVVTQGTQSVANNTTSITVAFYAYRTNTGYSTYADGSSITGKIDGVSYTGSFSASKKITNTPIQLYSKTQTVTHASNGTKTVSITAYLSMPGVLTSKNTETFSVTLTTIPRASTISSVTSSVTVNGSNAVTVSISRKSSSFTHTVTYSIGGTTKATQTGVATSTTYAIPWSWLGTSGTLSSKTVTVSVQTKSGSTNVGSAATATFTINPPAASTISSVTSPVSVNGSNKVTVALSRASSALTHTVTYKIGSTTKETQTSVGTSTTYTIPYSWLVSSSSLVSQTVTVSVQTKIVTTGVDANIGSAATKTFTINPPSASTVSSISSSVPLDGSTAIATTISRANSSVHHTVTYAIGGAVRNTQTNQSTSASYTPPTSWMSSYITTATSATCTVTVTAYITVDSAEKQLGSAITKSVTVTVPSSVVPSFNSITSAPSSTVVPSGWGVYVQGKSQAVLTVNGATGANGSTISSYTITGGATYTGATNSYTTPTISATGNITFTAYVTDSRGRTSDTKTVTINVEPYANPTVTGLTVFRADSTGTEDDDGLYIRAASTVGYSSCDGHNSWTVAKYMCGLASGQGQVDEWDIAEDGADALFGGAYSPDLTYVVSIVLTDALGSTVTQSVTVSTSMSTVDFKAGGLGVAFGKAAETDNLVEITDDWDFKAGNSFYVDNTNGRVGINNPNPTGALEVGNNLIYADEAMNSVGINAIPSHDDAFEVGGDIYTGGDGTNPFVILTDESGAIDRFGADVSTRQIFLTAYRRREEVDGANNYEHYRLPVPDVGTPSNASYYILTTKGIVNSGTINQVMSDRLWLTTEATAVDSKTSGITLGTVRVVGWGAVRMIRLTYTYNQAISVLANGNVTDLTVCVLKNGLRPYTVAFSAVGMDANGICAHTIDSDGNVKLTGFSGTGTARTIAAGTNLTAYFTFIV